jgi:hypothetical protein
LRRIFGFRRATRRPTLSDVRLFEVIGTDSSTLPAMRIKFLRRQAKMSRNEGQMGWSGSI